MTTSKTIADAMSAALPKTDVYRASSQGGFAYGRFGSKSNLDARNSNVCFDPMNRHRQ
jgi:hypothetical protein